jgi:hypothetical protein
MAWHAYEIPPIDINWRFLRTVDETARTVGAEDAAAEAGGATSEGPDIREFLASWESAKQAARDRGWDGDFRNEPVVFWLPDDTDFVWGFVVKQDNNGTTFVLSPRELPNVAALSG